MADDQKRRRFIGKGPHCPVDGVRPAGWRTDHPGVGPCAKHEDQADAAARRYARRDAAMILNACLCLRLEDFPSDYAKGWDAVGTLVNAIEHLTSCAVDARTVRRRNG